MSSHVRIRLIIFFLLGSLVVVGCAPQEDAQYIDRIEVIFDGESCIYDGPKVIFEGEVVVTINNTSEPSAVLEVHQITEGKTWEDVIEYYQEQSIGRPLWLTFVENSPILSEPNAVKFSFEPGLYAILCMYIGETSAGIETGTYLEVRAE